MSDFTEATTESRNPACGLCRGIDTDYCAGCRPRPAPVVSDSTGLRERAIRAVVTAGIDWEGRNASTWDRGASVVDAVLAVVRTDGQEESR